MKRIRLEETESQRTLHIGPYFTVLNESDYRDLITIFSGRRLSDETIERMADEYNSRQLREGERESKKVDEEYLSKMKQLDALIEKYKTKVGEGGNLANEAVAFAEWTHKEDYTWNGQEWYIYEGDNKVPDFYSSKQLYDLWRSTLSPEYKEQKGGRGE